MQKIKKAIIPAAGMGTRYLPATISCPKEMLIVVDKPVIQYIVEEAAEAGIEEILIVTREGKETIRDHFFPSKHLTDALKKRNKREELEIVKEVSSLAKISFVIQKEQRGLADAIYCGKNFAGNEPVAVLLGDIIFDIPAMIDLVKLFEKTGKDTVSVEYLDDRKDVRKYGVIDPVEKDPIKLKNKTEYFNLKDIVEKPREGTAPSRYAVSGRYIFNPGIFKLIEKTKSGVGGEIQITDSMQTLAKEGQLLACISKGKRYDIGDKVGFIKANLDFALKREDTKDEIKKFINDKLEKKND